MACLTGGGAVALLAWTQLKGFGWVQRGWWLVTLFLLTAPLLLAFKLGGFAPYAAAGLVLWYWPRESASGPWMEVLRSVGLMTAVLVLPWLALCAIPELGKRLSLTSVGIVLCGVIGARWLGHGLPPVPTWIGTDVSISRHSLGLMAGLEWLLRFSGSEERAVIAKLLALVFAVVVVRLERVQPVTGARHALVYVGLAVLMTSGATSADGIVLLVPLALWVGAGRLDWRFKGAAGWCLVGLLMTKDYPLPGGLGLAAAVNIWLLAALVGMSLPSVGDWIHDQGRLAAGLLKKILAAPLGPAYAGAAVTGGLALIFGRMTEDFSWGDRLLIPASGWLRFCLLAVSVAGHGFFLREIWRRRKISGDPGHD